MYTYKLKFNDGKKFVSTTKNLDETYSKIVNHINKNNLESCFVTCPNGKITKATKTGEYHWNHNGFRFEVIN